MASPEYSVRTTCRVCGQASLSRVLALGKMPIADHLPLTKNAPEPQIPLTLVHCNHCSLVQIEESVLPELLYGGDYPYFTGISPTLVKHFADSAMHLIEAWQLGKDSLVVEAASNDGTMLKNFAECGIPVLGIDPAAEPASRARSAGIETRQQYFDRQLASTLTREIGSCDLFIANNVLAHASDTNDFVAGIRELLKPSGIAVIEVPYLRDLVDGNEFDTIYHQHLCYFSVTTLVSLFERHALFVNDIHRTAIHGGSLRVFISGSAGASDAVEHLLLEESRSGLNELSYLKPFADRVQHLKDTLAPRLLELKSNGARLAGYGAAAKACTLLNYCGIDASLLDFIVDKNSYKQGRWMGGVNTPIVSPDEIEQHCPDYLVILAWNFAAEIMREQQQYAEQGGRFIVPLPVYQVHGA